MEGRHRTPTVPYVCVFTRSFFPQMYRSIFVFHDSTNFLLHLQETIPVKFSTLLGHDTALTVSETEVRLALCWRFPYDSEGVLFMLQGSIVTLTYSPGVLTDDRKRERVPTGPVESTRRPVGHTVEGCVLTKFTRRDVKSSCLS